MRREDREAMRGKTEERETSTRDERAGRASERTKREQMRGGPTANEPQKPSSPRPSGRLPLPD